MSFLRDLVEFKLGPMSYALVAGAVVDMVGAYKLLFHSSQMARTLDFPVPPELRFWPRYAAVFLLVLPAFYLVTASNPKAYHLNVAASVWGRFLGSAFYLWNYLAFPEHRHRRLLLVMALMNMLFAVVYGAWYLFWRLP